MSHHFKTQENGYSTLTMVGIGYTMRVTYPEVRVLSYADLEKLIALLETEQRDLLSNLCADLLKSETYLAHEGGEAKVGEALQDPVKLQGVVTDFEVASPYVQGLDQVRESLEKKGKRRVRRVSVVSGHALFIVYINKEITESYGVVRISLRTLNDLAAECAAQQGIVTFAN